MDAYQRSLPVAAFSPHSSPGTARTTTSSTTTGVPNASARPDAAAFQTSLPVRRSSARSDRLSLEALTITRSLYSVTAAPEPQPLGSERLPTSAFHRFLPSWPQAWTPDLPKNAYTASASAAGVLLA